MKLFSTRNKRNIVNLQEAVLNAFPVDKGLYMPSHIEKLDVSIIDNIKDYDFKDLSFKVCQCLISESVLPHSELRTIIDKAISFPAPLVTLNSNISTLELFHGPSMAFKDFGARFMAELMSYFLRNNSSKTTILVATSGDTGGAVASGFHNVEGIEVIILFPKGKVSPLQEKQLTTWSNNIHAIEIDGVFDDCQRLVKTAFLDEDLKNRYNFSSANSINIARLIPQSFYYFEAYKQVEDKSKPIIISIPSGNFGNLTAGLLAKKMGLPIHQFLAATNINDTVPYYLKSGEYEPKESRPTISNAMDVGSPSNFERMMALYGSTWNMIKNDITGYSYNDDETKEAIREVYNTYKYISDPHGAIGYLACKDYLKNHPESICVFLETAHPAKFTEVVNSTLGFNIEIPTRLKAFMDKRGDKKTSTKNFEDFKSILLSRS